MQKQIPDWLLNQLPEYEKVEYVNPAFSDSTHQLWRLQGSSSDNKNHFLKLCSNTESPFWMIMQDLFECNLEIEIANLSRNYALIENVCSLNIPKLINNQVTENGSFILTSELDGTELDLNISDQMIQQLAKHLAELHSISNNYWGKLSKPLFTSSNWSERLATTLGESASRAITRQRGSTATPTRRANEMSKKWGGCLFKFRKVSETGFNRMCCNPSNRFCTTDA